MVGWCHRHSGHEPEPALGDAEGRGGRRAAVRGAAKSGARSVTASFHLSCLLPSAPALVFVLKFKSSHTTGTIFFVT